MPCNPDKSFLWLSLFTFFYIVGAISAADTPPIHSPSTGATGMQHGSDTLKKRSGSIFFWLQLLFASLLFSNLTFAAGAPPSETGVCNKDAFPKPLCAYEDGNMGILETLGSRIEADPFNLVAAVIFLLAILHTFMTSFFNKWSHDVQQRHIQRLIDQGTVGTEHRDVSFLAQMLHFLGEVEAIFGIWVLALMVAITSFHDWHTVVHYIDSTVIYIEPLFVVIIMTLAATRPILNFAENALRKVAGLGNGTPTAWWLAILSIAPILGSFITEPAAMTIAALLLGRQFYGLRPPAKLEYSTLGLLFVNISVGGTLTNFAAPPILMVAAKWEWSSWFVMSNFGWKAVIGILVSNAVYYFYFRKEFRELDESAAEKKRQRGEVEVTSDDQSNLVPTWVTLVHMAFMGWTVFMAHYPALFIGGFIFFLGFYQSTTQHQNKLELKGAILVGFFLAGLVTHGGLQGWWIAPVLSAFDSFSLMLVSIGLTAFNDNAAITYLSTLVPNFSDNLKYAVVAGAVTGGGLTVIANAPNPAGQSILAKYFKNKRVDPLKLFLSALVPTFIVAVMFLVL